MPALVCLQQGHKALILEPCIATVNDSLMADDGAAWHSQYTALRAGLQSKQALAAKLQGVRVHCKVKSKDMYGRNVSRCSTDGLGDIGHWLVSNGYAIAYR